MEEFNNPLRSSQKVRSIEEGKIRRKPLKQFEKYLKLENSDQVSLISNKKMEKNQLITQFHGYFYIPTIRGIWFMLKTFLNSSKGKRPPSEEMIVKLKKRNI